MSDCIFEVDDPVLSESYGEGEVTFVSSKPNNLYPVRVKFKTGKFTFFGPQGQFISGGVHPQWDIKHIGDVK